MYTPFCCGLVKKVLHDLIDSRVVEGGVTTVENVRAYPD